MSKILRLASAVLLVFLILLASPSSAVPRHSKRTELTTDVNSLVDQTFTHIIVGGGTAGMVLANRLSERPDFRILVIEGGQDTRHDINIYRANETYAFNQASDIHSYKYKTVAQINNTIKTEWFGRGIGGSTTVNGQVWNAPSREQGDHIGALGNPGWSFDNLLHYFIKAQDYYPPSKELADFGVTYDPNVHRKGGPVTISHLQATFSGPPQAAFVKGVKTALGVDPVLDLQSGHNDGVAYVAHTMYPNSDLRRMSSATAYYSPIEGKRPNLVILLNHRAIRLAWEDRHHGFLSRYFHLRASGVVVQSAAGSEEVTLSASKEVIISAGTIRSPFLLEHSGVGDSLVLAKMGVKTKLNLPGVGKHLVEKCQVSVGAKVKDKRWKGDGASSSIAQPTARQIFANVTNVEQDIRSNLHHWAKEQVNAGAAVSVDAVLKMYKLIAHSIFRGSTPTTEMFFGNGFWGTESGLSISTYTLTPFSRGYSHASSPDPWATPELNPRFWTVPLDMDIEVRSLIAAQKVLSAPEMVEVREQDTPVTPQCNCAAGSDEEYAFFRAHIIHTYLGLDHAVGTCIMMPRGDGGVVDSNCKVWGTANVRVVDSSILPMQISAHPQATVYAIAEKAADVIKAASVPHYP